MRFTREMCGICKERRAALFMVVREREEDGRQLVSKAHVCVTCFEEVREFSSLCVEEMSLQEFKEICEVW